MSLFECINGHEMSYSEKSCKICGGFVHKMDGIWDESEPKKSSHIIIVNDDSYFVKNANSIKIDSSIIDSNIIVKVHIKHRNVLVEAKCDEIKKCNLFFNDNENYYYYYPVNSWDVVVGDRFWYRELL